MTNLKLWNNTDLDNESAGTLAAAAVRKFEIEALVDTGATMLALPEDVISALGVRRRGTRRARDARGVDIEVGWATGIYLEILGRGMTCDALIIPAGATPLIGQMQLEELDLVVDPKSREVHVNPASPDMPCMDLKACG